MDHIDLTEQQQERFKLILQAQKKATEDIVAGEVTAEDFQQAIEILDEECDRALKRAECADSEPSSVPICPFNVFTESPEVEELYKQTWLWHFEEALNAHFEKQQSIVREARNFG